MMVRAGKLRVERIFRRGTTAGEIIIASKRIRLSWFNAGWMLAVLLFRHCELLLLW
jgi:hypothetical protein